MENTDIFDTFFTNYFHFISCKATVVWRIDGTLPDSKFLSDMLHEADKRGLIFYVFARLSTENVIEGDSPLCARIEKIVEGFDYVEAAKEIFYLTNINDEQQEDSGITPEYVFLIANDCLDNSFEVQNEAKKQCGKCQKFLLLKLKRVRKRILSFHKLLQCQSSHQQQLKPLTVLHKLQKFVLNTNEKLCLSIKKVDDFVELAAKFETKYQTVKAKSINELIKVLKDTFEAMDDTGSQSCPKLHR